MESNILFLCHYPAVYGGNFIPTLLALEEKLSQRNIRCIYCFPKEAADRDWFRLLEGMGKEILTMDLSQSRRAVAKAVQALCRRYHVGILYAHFVDERLLSLLSWQNPRLRIFNHMHSDFSGGGTVSPVRRMKHFLLYHVLLGRVQGISVGQDLVSLNPRKIVYVPNALAENRLPCTQESREEMRTAAGVASEEMLIELYGWSPEIKGVDIAVKAVKLLNRQGMPVKLALVCGPDPEQTKAWIRTHTDCSGEEDFLVYWKPREDVFSFHRAADLLLSASRSEGFSYSLLEMLSLGKPCVISDIPGTRWAAEYPIVRSFPTEVPEDCAQALKAAMALSPDPQTAQSIHSRYCMNAWINAVISLLGV